MLLSKLTPWITVIVSLAYAAMSESVLLTGSNSRYSTTTKTISVRKSAASATIPSRNSPFEARMLSAVAAASPGTSSVEGTYIIPTPAHPRMTRTRIPAVLAYALGEISVARCPRRISPASARCSRNPSSVHLFPQQGFKDTLQRGVGELFELDKVEAEIHGGWYHTGLASVVRQVPRR